MLISPPRLLISARHVDQTQRLEMENRGSVALNVHVGAADELAQSTDGSSVVEPEGPYSAAGWITVVPDHFSVPPATRRYILVDIRVPAHPEPGDQDVVLTFRLPPRAGHGNIRIVAGIGVPTIITVPGPVIDHVNVTGLTAPGFSAAAPSSSPLRSATPATSTTASPDRMTCLPPALAGRRRYCSRR